MPNTPALAETTQHVANVVANKPSSFYLVLMNILPFVLIFAVFYFILIMPQRKKQKAHRLMMDALKVGDTVILSSGIVGKVTKLKGSDRVFIKTAEDTEIEVLRSFVANIIVV